jgi:hypothetical protein
VIIGPARLCKWCNREIVGPARLCKWCSRDIIGPARLCKWCNGEIVGPAAELGHSCLLNYSAMLFIASNCRMIDE